MKVHRRGDHGEYVYLGCSARHVGGCDNKRFCHVDKIERLVLPRTAVEVLDDQPTGDPIAALEQQITAGKSKASEIETAYQRSISRSGDLAERTQAKLEVITNARLMK